MRARHTHKTLHRVKFNNPSTLTNNKDPSHTDTAGAVAGKENVDADEVERAEPDEAPHPSLKLQH